MLNKKEQIERLTKYLNLNKDKLAQKQIPMKHKTRPAEYQNFLRKEISDTLNKIDVLKLEPTVEAKK